jgi:hypothetical protein
MFAYYSWVVAQNVGLDASCDDMQNLKGIRENAWDVNSMKIPVIKTRLSVEFA